MRIKFTQRVAIPGGPTYLPGDLADTDAHFMPPARAAEFVRRGWAREEPIMDATTKAPLAPPVDKMLTRDKAATKP